MDEDCAWDCRDWGGGGWRVGFGVGVGVGVGVGLAAREVGERGLHLWVEGVKWDGVCKFGWMEVIWS